jgi:hypothetical protein
MVETEEPSNLVCGGFRNDIVLWLGCVSDIFLLGGMVKTLPILASLRILESPFFMALVMCGWWLGQYSDILESTTLRHRRALSTHCPRSFFPPIMALQMAKSLASPTIFSCVSELITTVIAVRVLWLLELVVAGGIKLGWSKRTTLPCFNERLHLE